MDINIITVFFGMALTVAFTKLVEAPNATWETWVIFGYFVFRRTSYYVADVKFIPFADAICKGDIVSERFISLISGIFVQLLFIASGYFVNNPSHFLMFNAFSLFVNIGFLVMVFLMIDPSKDAHHKLPIRKMLINFIWINAIEIAFSFGAAICLHNKFGFGYKFDDVEAWIIGISIGTLFFIMFIDFILHKDFLFDPKYSPHKKVPERL